MEKQKFKMRAYSIGLTKSGDVILSFELKLADGATRRWAKIFSMFQLKSLNDGLLITEEIPEELGL